MKRAALLAVFALGACTPTFLQSGRYACERGEEAQCPGAWRCGLEGFCHQKGDTSVAWRCEESADCEGGFSCGLSKSREFRECHDPAAPKPFPCETSADCVGGWRCGLDELCVDPSADALGEVVLAGLGGGEHLNPRGSMAPITALSVSPFFTEGSSRGRGNVAFVQDNHLRARSLDVSQGVGASYDLGTELPAALLAHGARGLGGELNPREDELERVSVLWADGGLSTFRFANGGVAGEEAWGDSIPAFDVLSHGSASGLLMPSVFAFRSAVGYGYARIRGDWTYVYALDTAEGPNFYEVPGNRLRSITSLKFSDAAECVYVVDDRGLWVSQRGGTLPSGDVIASWDFEPVNLGPFTHTECPGSQGPKISSVTALGDRWLAVTATQPGSPSRVSILDASRTWISRGGAGQESLCATLNYLPCTEADRVPVDVALGPCEACPVGTSLSSLSLVGGGATSLPALEVVCGQAGFAPAVFQLTPGASVGACSRRPISGASSFFTAPAPSPGLPAPGLVAFSGEAGHLWYGTDAAHLAGLSFDRAATGVVRRGPGRDDFLTFTADLTGVPTPSLGLKSTRAPQLSASVAHAPSMAVSGPVVVDLSGGEKTIGYTNALELGSPVSAALTRSAQGNRFVVLSAGTSLYAGDGEATLSSSSLPAALSQRLTLAEPISALAFPREHAAGSSPLLTGYAIFGENLVRVVADTPTRWRTEAVPLPPTLAVRATWFQGTRGRVGFHDGSVFSLPSRVRIADPLPGGEAVDFAQTCGQQLALSPAGLFRLEAEASGPVGQWRPLSLPPELSGLDFTEGRVHGLGNDVFVFTRAGEAARLTFDTCPE